MMKTIAFFVRHFGERGTEVSVYDYAHFNETLLGNKSLIISFHPSVIKKFNLHFVESVYQKFLNRFEVIHVQKFFEINEVIEKHGVDIFYTQTHGSKELPPYDAPDFKIKSIVHCVFNTKHPQGTIYSAISVWVNESNQTNYPVVPYTIYLLETKDDLREQLNIPKEAIVFGRYGGYTQFDVELVKEAVIETALSNPDIYFIFMNTQPFGENLPNVKFLPMQIDLLEKRKFINTCDAHIHARADGETFGLACGEFAVCMKPLLTYKFTDNIAHIKILKDQIVLYETKEQLIKLLVDFRRGKYEMKNNGYLNYAPEKVMDVFNKIFILSENKKNYNLSKILLKNRLRGLLHRAKKLFTNVPV